ncbi:hypothetical protein [Arthrobacter bambusae]
METRGFGSPQRRSDVGSMVDKVLAEAKANGWDRLDRPLGTVVLNPDATGEDRQGREFGAVVRKNRAFQWLSDGVTPGEVKEYWDHGFISHLCYDVLDGLIVQASGIAAIEGFSAEGRDFGSLDEAIGAGAAQVRTLWPVYGTIEDVHLQFAEPDRPLPYEARLWVDKWRFRRFSEDGDAFLQELSSSSSFNAAARRARAADPELAAALKRAGQPAPVYGLPPAPRPSQSQRAEVLDDLQVEPIDVDTEDHESYIERSEEEPMFTEVVDDLQVEPAFDDDDDYDSYIDRFNETPMFNVAPGWPIPAGESAPGPDWKPLDWWPKAPPGWQVAVRRKYLMLPFDTDGLDIYIMIAKMAKPADLSQNEVTEATEVLADAIAWKICEVAAKEQIHPIDILESSRPAVEGTIREKGERVFGRMKTDVEKWLRSLDNTSDSWKESIWHGAGLVTEATNYEDYMFTRIEDVLLEATGIDQYKYRYLGVRSPRE